MKTTTEQLLADEKYMTPQLIENLAVEAAKDTGRLQLLREQTDIFISKNYSNGHADLIDLQNEYAIAEEAREADELQELNRDR